LHQTVRVTTSARWFDKFTAGKLRPYKVSRHWKVNAAFFPGIGKFRALFSEAWENVAGFSPRLGKFRASLSKAWKNTGHNFQSLDNRASAHGSGLAASLRPHR
jgi:hypothetical protein